MPPADSKIQPSVPPTVGRGGGAPRVSLRQFLNLPNLLTLGRLCAIPFFLSFVSRGRYDVALYIFAGAALTDGLDGAIARWAHEQTELGAFLDPLADKLLLVSAFVVLTVRGDFAGWVLSVVIIRDVLVVAGYAMLSFVTGEGVPVRPSYVGKTSTVLQLACVIGALARLGGSHPTVWAGIVYAMVAVTALSGLHYFYRGIAWLNSREPAMLA